MSRLVADASGLVSLGIAAGEDPDPLAICLDRYDVVMPSTVLEELHAIATYEDAHGRSAEAVLDRTPLFSTRSVDLDAEFPLDDGENAAVTLANDVDAALFLCDEFTHLGLIHASLADTRLVTTPTMLSVFVRTGAMAVDDARRLLDDISDARSWSANSYVRRARSMLDAGDP
jgi:predicted nucleic acid-binding protein